MSSHGGEIIDELNNKIHAIITVGDVDVWITQTIVVTWIWMAILTIFCIIARSKLSKWNENGKPTGFQNIVEFFVETLHNYVSGTMGKQYSWFGSYFFGVFTLIICFNLSGLILLRPPTADVATTGAFAIITFLLVHFMGITRNTKAYFEGYVNPFFIMLPLNIISHMATPISLCFRLFGATLGGFIIMELYYSLIPFFAKIGLPVILHGYFDVFAGCLQAFIFVTLSMTFIREILPEE